MLRTFRRGKLPLPCPSASGVSPAQASRIRDAGAQQQDSEKLAKTFTTSLSKNDGRQRLRWTVRPHGRRTEENFTLLRSICQYVHYPELW